MHHWIHTKKKQKRRVGWAVAHYPLKSNAQKRITEQSCFWKGKNWLLRFVSVLITLAGFLFWNNYVWLYVIPMNHTNSNIQPCLWMKVKAQTTHRRQRDASVEHTETGRHCLSCFTPTSVSIRVPGSIWFWHFTTIESISKICLMDESNPWCIFSNSYVG